MYPLFRSVTFSLILGLATPSIPANSKGGKLLDRMKPSYVRGPDQPLLEKTIDRAVRHTAERFPDREAVVSRHQHRHLTWREFNAEDEVVARGLTGLGLQTQDRVGVWASNCIEWLLLQVACSRANLVLVNVNPAYRAHDLSYVLRKSRMRALFLRENDARANYREILEQTGARPEHVVYLDHPSLCWLLSSIIPSSRGLTSQVCVWHGAAARQSRSS